MQFEIDFSGRLPVSAQEGMARCDDSADPRWKRMVDGAIQAVAKEKQEFTADDVLAKLGELPNPPSTHNASALGPRMKEVSKTLKYMEPTDQVKRSERVEAHGHFLRVWKSRIYFEVRS